MKTQKSIRYYMNEKQLDNSLEFTCCSILGLPADDRIHRDIITFDLPDYLEYHYGSRKDISNEMIDDILASKSYLVERWKYMAFVN